MEAVDVAIVGSGPAGLSAAAHAAALGISHVLLEKADHLSDTIFKYQKGKHIMATPDALVLRSDVAFQAGSREAILGEWEKSAQNGTIKVKYNADVTAISGARGDFTLTLGSGETLKAKAVVLAIGTQGNPNTLRCPGADLPFIQYTLADPTEYVNEHIIVIGGGDAGIENALGLVADSEQGNKVTLLQFAPDFPTAKAANVKALMAAKDEGRLDVITEASTSAVEKGWITVDTKSGQARLPCDRVIARIGSAPPRKFVESCGVAFASPDRFAFPTLSPEFETSVPGIYVIGALAGYPLIKHCMNQGYDVIEFIRGNTQLLPADEPLLQKKFEGIPEKHSVAEWLDYIRTNVDIFSDLSPLQMREFMLDSTVRWCKPDELVFAYNDIGSSLFAIVSGAVKVESRSGDRTKDVLIKEGTIFGEVGLISGRRRGATIKAAEHTLLVEVPRNAALKLIATSPAVKAKVDRITTERQLLQIFGSGLTPADIAPILDRAELKTIKAGDTIITEGEESFDVYVIRLGSMVVEKMLGGKPVFLSYLPANSYVGEMALLEQGRRTATVRASIKSEVVKLPGPAFLDLLKAKPKLREQLEATSLARREINSFIEAEKNSFGSVVDLHSSVANFLMDRGIGEATDALLIDERLCIGCDNCEVACAETHGGLSRLDREAGATYAHIHVPTSCRHCEHPHCMSDCPPNAIHRAPDGEVYITDSCIGCGNCQRYCPYGVIQLDYQPPKKPGLLQWLFFGMGPGPGQPPKSWIEAERAKDDHHDHMKKAIKCDMCRGIEGGAACVRACPTGAAIRVSPEQYLSIAGSRRSS
jgi:thioredoxin reductase/Fe-S-cluster-containing hydrogenase component 2/CRP-like cAMP-binding protein